MYRNDARKSQLQQGTICNFLTRFLDCSILPPVRAAGIILEALIFRLRSQLVHFLFPEMVMAGISSDVSFSSHRSSILDIHDSLFLYFFSP
jgi:hypothetical protein